MAAMLAWGSVSLALPVAGVSWARTGVARHKEQRPRPTSVRERIAGVRMVAPLLRVPRVYTDTPFRCQLGRIAQSPLRAGVSRGVTSGASLGHRPTTR